MKPFRGSLRLRLTAWYTSLLAAAMLAFAVLVFTAVRHELLHHHDDDLRETARSVVAILDRQQDCATLHADQLGDLARLERLVLVHELAGQRQVFYRSRDLPDEVLPRADREIEALFTRPESFATIETPRGALRIYSVRYVNRTGRRGAIRVMDVLGNVSETLATLRWVLTALIPVSLVLSGTGGYWLAARALRPVDEVTRLAREIEATNLERRLPSPSSNDELGRLVNTFNGMIARLEGAFDGMKQFTADASHELRTPLTVMKTAIEVHLAAKRGDDEHRKTLSSVLEEVERMSRIVADLLLFARVDAGATTMTPKPLQFDLIVTDVVEMLKPLSATSGVELVVARNDPAGMLGDEHWLRQMVLNLVENAVRHGGDGKLVEIRSVRAGPDVVLTVRDEGPGIPQDEQARIFERFYRVDRSRARNVGGAGLGLALALWVARSHAGTIDVDCKPGRGAEFTVRIPAAM